MAARLIESLATTDALADLFSDASLLQAMLDFEVALARAEACKGIIPKAAAVAIRTAAQAKNFDIAKLARETLRAGTAGIPVAKALTAKVRASNADASRYVHWGATSEDVADTGLILALKRAQQILASDLDRLEKALQRLSDRSSGAVMLGRTLLQPAPPVTFGLKAAGWLGSIRRSSARLDAAFAEALVLQFGGASGTLAALGDKGLDVGRAMAEDLGLGFPDAPWHANRDRLAAPIAACGVLTGCLGKMARDISLLMQREVGEAAEPGGHGRGGSSTMPQKRNPIASALTLAAAHRVPGLVSAFLSAMVQEHERGVGGWQSEWATVADVIQSTGLAIVSMAEAAEGLSVDKARMRENIEATRGAIFAERANVLLRAKLGREAAQEILEEALQRSEKEKRELWQMLADIPEAARVLGKKTIHGLETPEEYLGVAEELRERLLKGPRRSSTGNQSARKRKR
jgi:3-carboxy-cis,cis-muconate cycloisomerase